MKMIPIGFPGLRNHRPIPFNKPSLTGREISYIHQVVRGGQIAGNGEFTRRVQEYFMTRFSFQKVLLTTTCTHGLEMAGLLMNIREGDEVIMPSFTFVSTANAFILRGARIVFADSNPDNPNIDPGQIEPLINERTRMIVPVHYAGIACDMDPIMELARKYRLFVVEDAAQAIHGTYKGNPLGSFGQLSAFSFHETKNVSAGEGGILVINDPQFNQRAEVIWEKGTNRQDFLSGRLKKYDWVDIGSTFYPSEITAAFLMAQLENLEKIQERRTLLWNIYQELLSGLEARGISKLPRIPEYAAHNAHIFYIVLNEPQLRERLISGLKSKGIHAVFHFQSLHRSEYYRDRHDGRKLPWSDFYSDCLLRLPLYYTLKEREITRICNEINKILT
jgi:dTDP-4-amino-4,6-dideoxygalactose transaminase